MGARAPSLAKLTRPKLYDALPRPRLFALLDEAATRPVVWLTALAAALSAVGLWGLRRRDIG